MQDTVSHARNSLFTKTNTQDTAQVHCEILLFLVTCFSDAVHTQPQSRLRRPLPRHDLLVDGSAEEGGRVPRARRSTAIVATNAVKSPEEHNILMLKKQHH